MTVVSRVLRDATIAIHEARDAERAARHEMEAAEGGVRRTLEEGRALLDTFGEMASKHWWVERDYGYLRQVIEEVEQDPEREG